MATTNYVETINKKYQRSVGISTNEKSTYFDPFDNAIRKWASKNSLALTDIKLSGSRAKGTAISLSSDMDMFISIASSNTATLSSIFNLPYYYFNNLAPDLHCKKQNVSVDITYKDMNIDLVPGRRQSQYDGDHSLYKSKRDSWTQTNIDEHIRAVKNSNRIPEIVAAKIWRQRHNLSFPSIFLELATLEALKNKGAADHDSNFRTLLAYFADNIQTIKIIDPANSNNIISNNLTAVEKKTIADTARESTAQEYWKNILW